jgi:hypothetical protein
MTLALRLCRAVTVAASSGDFREHRVRASIQCEGFVTTVQTRGGRADMHQLRRPFGWALVQVGAFCCKLMSYPFFGPLPAMTRSKLPKRFTISLDARDYEALRMLAEAQRPPLPLQYVVRLAVLRLLDQPDSPLLRPERDNSR